MTAVADNADDEPVMYIVVNTSLDMSIGKTCAQVGHSVQYVIQHVASVMVSAGATESLRESERVLLDNYRKWADGSHAKVVLGASAREFERLLNEGMGEDVVSLAVTDEGRTEVVNGAQTVVAFCPMRKSQRSSLLKRLRLL